MGQPAMPTPEDRIARRALARRIVAAVIDDEAFPYDEDAPHDDASMVVQELERLAFELADEVLHLTQDRLVLERAAQDVPDTQGRAVNRSVDNLAEVIRRCARPNTDEPALAEEFEHALTTLVGCARMSTNTPVISIPVDLPPQFEIGYRAGFERACRTIERINALWPIAKGSGDAEDLDGELVDALDLLGSFQGSAHDWRAPNNNEAKEEGGVCVRCGVYASESTRPCIAVTRDEAIEIAVAQARAHLPPYFEEPFVPHEWVIAAIMEAGRR